ncbi:MAG: hypothetical protein L3K17_03945 [Thermoplasmata archaeon]|nr:hypothetical protein [Thermoplasmata archaeon]
MPASPESAPAVPGSAGGGVSRSAAASTAPVAVVWCRQVDNEAESPGYTTVPEEFPGLRETLDVIRIVGHLTVNVADTHDYWDPDPAQPLSYYPNLFLYPAYGGRYTCVGRMFLSTEDRPRLGMKTLVLDTQQLLASGDFGGTILRWHASMGGPRGDGGRPAPVPDPRLYDAIGEGFLFHKGSTEPVVAVASDDWEAAIRVVVDLVRSLPASLVALGAILAFPYFLPQPKTNLHEFTEQLPTALALMRVPRGEAAGDRHEKRMASWESAPVSLRDLTGGPPSPPKGKETTPLVLQFIRDHNAAKLAPIVQRVDLVEMPRLRGHLADPERQGGRDRRKEMWRIGTAMESAALLLQRARGRHVPVNVETAKRAQEYLQARLPDPSETPPNVENEPFPVAVHAAGVTLPSQHPPWLQRGVTEVPPAPASNVREVVPVSVSEDPSLLPASARPPAPLETPMSTSPPAPPPGGASLSAGVTPTDLANLRQQITSEFLRFVDERMAAQAALVPPAPVGLDSTAQQQVDGRLAGLRETLTGEISRQVGGFQDRIGRDLSASELRQRELLAALVATEIDRRWADKVDPKITALLAHAEARALADRTAVEDRLKGRLDEIAEELRTHAAASEDALRTALAAQLDVHLSQAAERDRGTRTALEALLLAGVDARVHLADVRHAKEFQELEQRLTVLADGRQRETQDRLVQRGLTDSKELEGRFSALTETRQKELQTRLEQLAVTQLRELKELEQRVAVSAETRQRELQTRLEQQALARPRELKELEQRLTALVDTSQKELQDRAQLRAAGAQGESKELLAQLDRRIADSSTKSAERLTALRGEVTDAQVRAIADLQVRLQAYTDQKVREDGERDRQTYIELLARLKGEVDSSINRFVESPRFEASVTERIERALATQHTEITHEVDDRVVASGLPLRAEVTDLTDRLQRLESNGGARRDDLTQLEETFRSELDDLDRRAQILADRLVPVVRKTWLRISELERQGTGEVSEEALDTVRREVQREVRRLETNIDERVGEIRDRMETSISNQGRVWLTLVRQLSQLTEDRRVIEQSRALLRDRDSSTDEATNLEALPGLLQPRSRPEPPADDPEADDRGRRRRRAAPRS